jgi:DNA-directed RNA polymerase specialized sigma24 family protein
MHNPVHRGRAHKPRPPSAEESLEGPFLRVARRYTVCEDDAWEALARAFEIALRHRERIRPETAAAWMRTVVANEARRVARARRREAALPAGWEIADPHNPYELPDDPDPRLGALRDALTVLRVDERRALLLFYGMSGTRRYARLMQATGWSYAKVNRALSEGRRRLRAVLIADAPDECRPGPGDP